jgi:hypothetical protein
MTWKWISSSHPISDIRDWNNSKRLEVRPDFQRQEVWSKAAMVMLMDTILQNIPMPKIFLEAVIRGDDTYRIVIDGQQRIRAILSFLRNEFNLSSPYKGDYLNLNYDDLPDLVKDDFLSYKIDINEIRNASDEIVREIYSRVNKYNIALNKQELRRADFPGQFLKLSEELSQHEFFEDSKIFSVANRRRMGDVEYISELLAILIEGIQDKKSTLDQFYQDYSSWPRKDVAEIKDRFQRIIEDILIIFPTEFFHIAKTRFRQKADYYSLFAAINELRKEGHSLEGKDVSDLRRDFDILNSNIAPEAGVELFSEYAIKCVSQGNTIRSRSWRKDFLKDILGGTYINKIPKKETIIKYHDILWDLYTEGSDMCPPYCQECPICKDEIKSFKNEDAKLGWPKETVNFQLSNAIFSHLECSKDSEYFHTSVDQNQLKLPHIDGGKKRKE